MVDLHHRVPITAAPEKVFTAIATQEGMRGWWTRDATLDSKVGGKAEFGFDKRGVVFRMTIDELDRNNRVRMTCSGDPAEWAGTTLEWNIRPTPEGAILSFVHGGWRERTDFCSSCNSMWGRLMFRLKDFVETGNANPQWTE